MADKCGMSHQLQKSHGLGGRMEEASHSHKGVQICTGHVGELQKSLQGTRLYDPGAELCRIGSGHGGKRARIGAL